MYSAQIRCLSFSCCCENIMGRKLFFFTDSPSGFPSSGNNHLKTGYADETRNCHKKYKKFYGFDVAVPQTGHSAYPWYFYAAGKENTQRASYPRKTVFATILYSSRKSEFELGGINHIRPFPELGTLEILSEFSSGNRDGKVVKNIKFPIRIL